MTQISASMIIEILGRPAEHVKEALNGIVEKLSKEKGVIIKDKKVHDLMPVEKSDNLFTSFAEISADFEKLDNYFATIFSYMPAHIEITSPQNLNIQIAHFNELGNAILQRLHHYDAVTKSALMNQDRVVKKLMEVAPHLFKNPQAAPKVEEKKPEKKQKSKKKSKK